MRFHLQRDGRAVLLSKIINVQKTVEIRLLQIAVEHLLADLHHPLHVLLSHSADMFQVRHGEKSVILCPLSRNVVLVLPLSVSRLQIDKKTLRNIFTFNIKYLLFDCRSGNNWSSFVKTERRSKGV